MDKENNNILNHKTLLEQDLEKKQNLIKSTIIDGNYDKNIFFNFCINKKKYLENGDNLCNWTLEELSTTITEFCSEQNKILEEQKQSQKLITHNLQLNINEINNNLNKFQSQNLSCSELNCKILQKSYLNNKKKKSR